VIISLAISPSIDVTMLVDHLRTGEGHRPYDVVRLAGGKGFNVARAASLLGGQAVAVGVVGGHAGRWLTDSLDDELVARNLIEGANETRSCVTIVESAAGRVTDFYPYATPISEGEWQRLAALCGDLMTTAPGWLAIAGSQPDGMPLDSIAQLAAAAHHEGWRVAVDTSGLLLGAALDAGADLIKVNADEAAAAVGVGTPQQLVARLGKCAAAAIVTNGADGAYTADHHITTAARGAYPVGSGDSFLAGYLTAIDDGPEGALRLAVGAAAANAEQPGAARFDPQRARHLAATSTISLSGR
jgi:1-phosphofructokinase family hexose kinase